MEAGGAFLFIVPTLVAGWVRSSSLRRSSCSSRSSWWWPRGISRRSAARSTPWIGCRTGRCWARL